MQNNEQLQLSDCPLSISSIYIANILLTGRRTGKLTARIFNLNKAAGVQFFLRYEGYLKLAVFKYVSRQIYLVTELLLTSKRYSWI